jgi:hypothetical protein
MNEESKQAEEWADGVGVVMSMLDTCRVIAKLATKSEGLSIEDARTAFHKVSGLLDAVHNDLDVLREEMSDSV